MASEPWCKYHAFPYKNPKPAVQVLRGEGRVRARPGHCDSMLRAHAASKMRHERKPPCGRAARGTAIGAARSIDQAANYLLRDKSGPGLHFKQWPLRIQRDRPLTSFDGSVPRIFLVRPIPPRFLLHDDGLFCQIKWSSRRSNLSNARSRKKTLIPLRARLNNDMLIAAQWNTHLTKKLRPDF